MGSQLEGRRIAILAADGVEEVQLKAGTYTADRARDAGAQVVDEEAAA